MFTDEVEIGRVDEVCTCDDTYWRTGNVLDQRLAGKRRGGYARLIMVDWDEWKRWGNSMSLVT